VSAPILYVTDLTFSRFDPADLSTLPSAAFPEMICAGSAYRKAAMRSEFPRQRPRRKNGSIVEAWRVFGTPSARREPVNLVVVEGFSRVAALLQTDRPLFRER